MFNLIKKPFVILTKVIKYFSIWFDVQFDIYSNVILVKFILIDIFSYDFLCVQLRCGHVLIILIYSHILFILYWSITNHILIGFKKVLNYFGERQFWKFIRIWLKMIKKKDFGVENVKRLIHSIELNLGVFHVILFVF